MLNNLTSRSLLFAAMLCAPWAPVAAQDEAQAKGLQIATEQKMRDRGWGDSESELQMTLRNAQGRESVRRMRALALEVQGDGDKSLTIFDEPMDVRGSAFLTHAHPRLKMNSGYIYPALNARGVLPVVINLALLWPVSLLMRI